jgi:hypothetical protein
MLADNHHLFLMDDSRVKHERNLAQFIDNPTRAQFHVIFCVTRSTMLKSDNKFFDMRHSHTKYSPFKLSSLMCKMVVD